MLFGIRQHCCNMAHDIIRLMTLFTWILIEQILKLCISIILMFPTHVTFIVMRSPDCRFVREVKLKPDPTCWEIDLRFRNSCFKYVTKPLLFTFFGHAESQRLGIKLFSMNLFIVNQPQQTRIDKWQLVGIYTAVKMQHKNSTQCLLLHLILTWRYYFSLL